MKFTIKSVFFALALLCGANAWAEIPNGYYISCEGKSGAALLSQLQKVVGNHTVVSYNGLWSLYLTTDVDEDGKIWDMYSTKRWTPSSDQCGNYTSVGDCYNREHSMPKSWFHDETPMYSDAFHLYPTDGKVNSQRSNYPYGECANGTSLAASGGVEPLGKLGTSTFEGYSGIVFEPDDEYKGDFARSYFYMAAAYNDRISTWESDMLAGNAYPAFTDWSVKLLMKWHLEDPVSEKELRRNEAVYAVQGNRNPFIDHPELADHIWGNKTSEGWDSGRIPDPEFILPAEGAVINLGTFSAGNDKTFTVAVKGNAFSAPVEVSISGTGLSVNPILLTADAVNEGTEVYITATSSKEATLNGTLTLTCGEFSRTASVTAVAVEGMTALEATNVTESSFVARWVDSGDSNEYTLNVMRAGSSIAGYPISVNAAAEEYLVSDLDPETTYTYNLTSDGQTSNTISVTTAQALPSIQITYDGELNFETEPQKPSAEKEIDLLILNTSEVATITVEYPFEVSTDKATWHQGMTLAPDEENFYLRLGAAPTGQYQSVLNVSAGDLVNDENTISGVVRSTTTFDETFEALEPKNSYTNEEWQGVAALWKCTNVGVYEADKDLAYEGVRCARYGNNADSSLEMAEDCERGFNGVSFWAKTWGNDQQATLVLEYSTDGGETWVESATFTLEKGEAYKEFKGDVNQDGPVRIRMRQTAGKRLLLDNVCAEYRTPDSGISTITSSRQWDAWANGGKVIIKAEKGLFNIYNLEGKSVYKGHVKGQTSVSLEKGTYIVVNGDNSKKIIVK